MYRVMGLDLSTCTGLSVVDEDKTVILGEEVTFKKLSGWERVNAIAGRIMEAHSEHQPDLVVLEGYGFGQMASVVTLAEIGSVVRFLLWQNAIPFIDVPPSSLKMFLGKGNLKKEMVRLECFKQHGYEHKSNDVVDAYVLAIMGLAMHGAYPLYSYQYNAISKVKTMRESKLWQPKMRKEPMSTEGA